MIIYQDKYKTSLNIIVITSVLLSEITSSFTSYEDAIKWEIIELIKEQKDRANFELSLDRIVKSRYFDIAYFKLIKNNKGLQISPFSSVVIKNELDGSSMLFANFIIKSKNTVEIALKDASVLSKNYKSPIYVMEADLLFLYYIQLDIIKRVKSNSDLIRISDLLSGKSEFKINILDNFESINYNIAQLDAINRIINLNKNNWITLIHGPPGTGKTYVISEAVVQLLKRGRSILITSHTNVAVDNALEKIYDRINNPKECIYRIGNPLITDSDRIRERYINSIDLIDDYKGKVIGMTLSKLSILINKRDFNYNSPEFDYVFFDEASMANLSLSLTSMIYARQVVLLGDPQQLPPIIKYPEAKAEVKESLFEKILKRYPSISTFLNIQYRSHPSIANFSSKMFYGGKLLSDESTESKYIDKEDRSDAILASMNNFIWLDSSMGGIEWVKFGKSHSACNLQEIAMIGCLINSFRDLGYNIGDDLKVITPFRLQANIIHQMIIDELSIDIDVEDMNSFPSASTIDRIQGREVSILIISLVDCGKNWKIHRILNDYRRLNVALTRAKHKVIIVASEILATHDTAPDFIKALFSYAKNYHTLVRDFKQCDIDNMLSLAEISKDRVIKL